MIVTVKVSNEEKTLKYKHLIMETDIKASTEDPTLKGLVEAALTNFDGPAEDVQVILNMTW